MSRVVIELPERFIFRTELPVRVPDLNYGNHVGHDGLLRYAHEARMQLFVSKGFTELDISGIGIAVADVAAIYGREAKYGMVLAVDVAVTGLRTRACDLYYRLTRNDTGQEVARMKTGVVFLDYRTGKVAHMPEIFRAAFADAPPSP